MEAVKLTNKKQINSLVFLFSITYMISYMTRINYGAIIAEMQTALGYSKSLLSISLTGSFITYGIGQIISGIFGDKTSPKRLVMYGLSVTFLMNLLIIFCRTPYQMAIIWSVNGFAQSLMWPPIVKIMSAVLSDSDYTFAVNKVSWGSSIGTILVYLLAPILISAFSWKAVFVTSAVLAFAMIFIWNKFAYDVKIVPVNKEKSEVKKTGIITPFIIFAMIAIVLQGMLRDGVTTWMPSYVAETFKLSNEISILTGVILPIFSILSFQLATEIYTRKINNLFVCAAIFFGIGAIAALGLSLLTNVSAAISIFMFAMLTGGMHGVNLMLICMLPAYFKNTGKVSTVSGLLNSCTYVGSAVSTYGIAVITEKFNWSVTILIWLAIASCGTIICTLCAKNWNKYKRKIGAET